MESRRERTARGGGLRLFLAATVVAVSLPALTGCAMADPSTITAGKAQIIIKEGASTKEDVIRGLGAPNIHYRKQDGTEMWTYEAVTAHETVIRGGAGVGSASVIPDAYSIVTAFMNVGGARRSSRLKTLTLTVYFDKNGVVTTYETFEGHF